MKKTVIIILSFCLIVAGFAACSSGKNEATTAAVSGVENQTGDPKNTAPATNKNGEVVSDEPLTIDSAKIDQFDAIELIKLYSAEELSLTEEDMKKCDFMCKNNGVEIKGDNYIEVDAVIKNEVSKNDDGTVTYTFDHKGEYFIRYDGKQILKKDMSAKKDKYTELEVKKLKKDKKD